jgi:predicted Zn-dependent protease
MLLVPADLDRYLTPAQLEAVLAHEWCHVRRRAHPIDGTPDRADNHDGAAGATRIAA